MSLIDVAIVYAITFATYLKEPGVILDLSKWALSFPYTTFFGCCIERLRTEREVAMREDV